MKVLIFILFGSLLFLTTTPVFAINAGATGQVKVTADVIDYNAIVVTPKADMRMPSTYSSETGDFYSNMGTNVIGGLPGQDAEFAVTGPPEAYYSINFTEVGKLFDSNGHQLILDYSYIDDEGGMSEPIGCKWLNGSGTGDLTMRGYMNLGGTQPAGKYNNYASPLIITLVVDDHYCNR